MATYIDVKRVQYLDASGVQAPLCRLFFCRYCLVLRAPESVSHEVDSYFCPNCLETMPAPEARLKKNRCTGCFDCPSCHHTLSTRASSVVVPSPDDPSKTVPRKVYYLSCAFCRWTSRDVGIPDQSVASGNWPIQENPHSKRITSLLEYYRQMALREKMDEKKRASRRRNYLHLTDKYGMSAMAARRKPKYRSMGALSLNEGEDLKIPDLSPGEVMEEFEELPDSVYTEPVLLPKVTSIEQRHTNPGFQPEHVSRLYPMYKQLLIKCSQRCKECEHNVCRPEFNPASIKFKIQLSAILHVPEIRIMQQANLLYNKETQAALTLCNPQDHVIHVTLSDATTDPQTTANKGWGCTANIKLPNSELVLPPRDDVAEFDDTMDQLHDYKDDPGVIVFRKANKIGFLIKVIPQRPTGEVKIALRMRYDYRNMTNALQSEKKGPEMVWLEQIVLLNLGTVVPDNDALALAEANVSDC